MKTFNKFTLLLLLTLFSTSIFGQNKQYSSYVFGGNMTFGTPKNLVGSFSTQGLRPFRGTTFPLSTEKIEVESSLTNAFGYFIGLERGIYFRPKWSYVLGARFEHSRYAITHEVQNEGLYTFEDVFVRAPNGNPVDWSFPTIPNAAITVYDDKTNVTINAFLAQALLAHHLSPQLTLRGGIGMNVLLKTRESQDVRAITQNSESQYTIQEYELSVINPEHYNVLNASAEMGVLFTPFKKYGIALHYTRQLFSVYNDYVLDESNKVKMPLQNLTLGVHVLFSNG